MIKHKLYTIAKINILVVMLVFTEFAIIPFDTKVSAQELYTYLKPQSGMVAVSSLNDSIANRPQPLTPSEVDAAIKKAEEEFKVQRIKQEENDRASYLDSFLTSKSSPLAGKGHKLVELEKRYNIPASLVIGISGVESNFCKINFRAYNCWGWMTSKQFTSYDQALEDYVYYLRSFYFDRGKTSPYTIQPAYCPDSTTWAPNVTRYMNQVG